MWFVQCLRVSLCRLLSYSGVNHAPALKSLRSEAAPPGSPPCTFNYADHAGRLLDKVPRTAKKSGKCKRAWIGAAPYRSRPSSMFVVPHRCNPPA